MSRLTIGFALVLTIGANGQEFVGGGDFLTDYEVDAIRDRQGLKERLQAYVKFATLRLELVEQILALDEAGQGARIHRALEEYGSIIESIDDVIDDALLRNRQLDGALEELLEAERGLAARLASLAADPGEDAWRYEFVLDDAILITQDSMDLLSEDLGDRKRTVVRQDEIDRQRQEESMAPERRRDIERARQAEEADSTQRKRPSLLRPGEKVGGK